MSRCSSHTPRAKAAEISEHEESLALEVAPDEILRGWIDCCRPQFVRDMAYGLLTSAIHSYDSGDLDILGQAVVDWTSTLELEADRQVVQRMQRRKRRDRRGGQTTVHGLL